VERLVRILGRKIAGEGITGKISATDRINGDIIALVFTVPAQVG